MEFNDIIARRRSIRKFTDKRVDHDLLESVLRAALAAPSSRNSRSTHFMVIEAREQLAQMATMRDYGSAFLASAPAAILVLGDTTATDLWQVNAAIAAATLQLACVDGGLASCWIQVEGRPQHKDNPTSASATDHLRAVLPIPAKLSPLCIIAVGYSDFRPAPLPESDDMKRVLWVE